MNPEKVTARVKREVDEKLGRTGLFQETRVKWGVE